jgi:hypothetical protein
MASGEIASFEGNENPPANSQTDGGTNESQPGAKSSADHVTDGASGGQ